MKSPLLSMWLKPWTPSSECHPTHSAFPGRAEGAAVTQQSEAVPFCCTLGMTLSTGWLHTTNNDQNSTEMKIWISSLVSSTSNSQVLWRVKNVSVPTKIVNFRRWLYCLVFISDHYQFQVDLQPRTQHSVLSLREISQLTSAVKPKSSYKNFSQNYKRFTLTTKVYQ